VRSTQPSRRWVLRMRRDLGKLVLCAPVRPTRAGVAYEVALKFLVAADTFIFAGSSDKAFSARTRRHGARAIPLDKDFVPIRVRDYARAIRLRMSFIDVVKESAIDSGFVQKAFALIVEYDPGHHTGINHAVLCKLLHLPGEGPAVVTGVFSALG